MLASGKAPGTLHKAGAQWKVVEEISEHVGLGDPHTVMVLLGPRGMGKMTSLGAFHPESGKARRGLEASPTIPGREDSPPPPHIIHSTVWGLCKQQFFFVLKILRFILVICTPPVGLELTTPRSRVSLSSH